MLSHSKSPVLFVQISNKKIRLLWSNCLKIRLLVSVLPKIILVLPQNCVKSDYCYGFFFRNCGKSDYCFQFFFKNVNCELFSFYFGNDTAKMWLKSSFLVFKWWNWSLSIKTCNWLMLSFG
jgi:hypothetical protein